VPKPKVFAVVKSLLAMVGIDISALEGKPKDATGMAAKSTSTGDVSGVLQKARENAFSLGSGAVGKPEVRTATATEELNKKVEAMATEFREIKGKVVGIYDGITGFPKAVADAIKGGIPSFLGGTPAAPAADGVDRNWVERRGKSARDDLSSGWDSLFK